MFNAYLAGVPFVSTTTGCFDSVLKHLMYNVFCFWLRFIPMSRSFCCGQEKKIL